MSTIAELRANEVSNGRQRLDAGRATLERYRANELEEAEALALARIKADTERALAHQAQTLRDAERAAELVAIQRRTTDLEAIKEAQSRQQLDREAEAAAAARSAADRLSTITADEKTVVLMAALEAQHSRHRTEREALQARQKNFWTRLSLAWLTLRSASPIVTGIVALLIGAGIGWLATDGRLGSIASPATEEAPLKLDFSIATPPVSNRGKSH